MLTKLFRDNIDSRNPATRLTAIERLDETDAEHQVKLARAAMEDSDENVRCAATGKVSDPLCLSALLGDSSGQSAKLPESVIASARARLEYLLSQPGLMNATDNARLAASGSREACFLIACHSVDETSRNAVLIMLDEQPDIARVITDSRYHSTRAAAAEKLRDEKLMSSVVSLIKERDKVVARNLQEQLDAKRDLVKRANEREAEITHLVDSMQQLSRSVWSPQYAGRFAAINTRWINLDPPAQGEQKRDYDSCYATSAALVEEFKNQQMAKDFCSEALKTQIDLAKQLKQAPLTELDAKIKQIKLESSNAQASWRVSVETATPDVQTVKTYDTSRNLLLTDLQEAEKLLALNLIDSEVENLDSAAAKRALDVLVKIIGEPDKVEEKGRQYMTDAAVICRQLGSRNKQLDNENEAKAKSIQKQLGALSAAIKEGKWSPANSLYSRIDKKLSRLEGHQEQKSMLERLARHKAKLDELADWQNFAAKPKLESLCEQMESLPAEYLQVEKPQQAKVATHAQVAKPEERTIVPETTESQKLDSDAAKADVAKADVAKADTAKADAAKADVAKADVAKADVAKADLAKADLAKADVAKADVAKADVAKADAAKTDAAKTDAAKTDVAKTDVAKTDVAKTNTANAEAGKAGSEKSKRFSEKKQQARLQELGNRIKELQQEWKSLGPSPVANELWDRFKAAADTAYEPVGVLRQTQKEERETRQKNKELICVELDAFLESTQWEEADWKLVEKTLRNAKNRWRDNRIQDRKPDRAIEQRFSDLITRFNEKLNVQYDANAAAKVELIEKVQKLSESEINQHVVNQTRKLQNSWKQSGIVRRKQDQELWEKFNGFCREIYKHHHAAEKLKTDSGLAHVKQAKDIIRSIKDMCKKADADDKKFTQLQEQFNALAEFPPNDKKYLLRDFNQASLQFSRLKEKSHSQAEMAEWAELERKSAMCARFEALVGSQSDSQALEDLNNEWEETTVVLPKAWEKRINKRKTLALSHISSATQYDFAEGEKNRRLICIKAEILTGKDTPSEDKQLRMAYQLENLQQGLGSSAVTDVKSELKSMVIEWLCMPPGDPANRERLESRFQQASK